MNVSSLTLWLSDFHTVQFSVSSGWFLFLNLLSFFWLCKEEQYIHLRLHVSESPASQFLTTLCGLPLSHQSLGVEVLCDVLLLIALQGLSLLINFAWIQVLFMGSAIAGSKDMSF